MSQTATTSAPEAINLFTAAASLPRPVCVTAFIAPQSLIELNIYSDGTKSISDGAPLISVGTYMSDRSIWHICNFTNAANALKYAFMLKKDNCPISKHAMSLLMAEIKRTGAVSTRAKARAEAKARKEALENEKAEQAVKSKIESEKEVATERISLPASKTPIFKQYADMKKKHPDAIILFRIGDFYECFDTDAQIAADVLGITLTSRANGKSKKIHLAGFPQHALDTYLPKLVRAGHRVAICEQISKAAKK